MSSWEERVVMYKHQPGRYLVDEFVDSRGGPILYHDNIVIQMDRIPIHSGTIRFRFFSSPDAGTCEGQGVRLSTGPDGYVLFADGSSSSDSKVYVWHQADLPNEVLYPVFCPAGTLWVCNIYRLRYLKGDYVSEEWGWGNAGMTILDQGDNWRRYGCSDALGEFTPTDLVFELEWHENNVACSP